jgi:hypothetical protein
MKDETREEDVREKGSFNPSFQGEFQGKNHYKNHHKNAGLQIPFDFDGFLMLHKSKGTPLVKFFLEMRICFMTCLVVIMSLIKVVHTSFFVHGLLYRMKKCLFNLRRFQGRHVIGRLLVILVYPMNKK